MPLDWQAPEGMFIDRQDVPGVFQTIYAKNVWHFGSGIGSNPQAAKAYMAFLQAFLVNNPIHTIVDIGCGDWKFSQFVDWGNCDYLGIDVVPSVIEANTQRFGAENRRFICANPLDPSLAPPAGDLLLIKDVLQHLSNANVRKMLELTRQFKYSLITNAYSPQNEDCENGDTRSLDVRAEPFNLKHAVLSFAFQNKAVFLVVTRERFE